MAACSVFRTKVRATEPPAAADYDGLRVLRRPGPEIKTPTGRAGRDGLITTDLLCSTGQLTAYSTGRLVP